MLNPKNNLVFAACGGSLVLIATFAITFAVNGEGSFWLSLILGAGVLVTLYLLLFIHGLRFAAMLDAWEKSAPEYNHKAPAMIRGWEGTPPSGMVYLFPDGLTLVWRKGGRLQTLRVERKEILQIIPGREDLELLLTENRILSFDWGEEEEASKKTLELASDDK